MGGIPDASNRLAWNSGTGQAFRGQAICEHQIKLGKGAKATKKMIGLVGNLVKFWVKTAFTDLSSGVRIEIVVDTAVGFGVDPEVIASTGILSLAEVNAGNPIQIVIPPTQLGDRLTLLDADVFLTVRWSPVSQIAGAGNAIVQIDDSPESMVT